LRSKRGGEPKKKRHVRKKGTKNRNAEAEGGRRENRAWPRVQSAICSRYVGGRWVSRKERGKGKTHQGARAENEETKGGSNSVGGKTSVQEPTNLTRSKFGRQKRNEGDDRIKLKKRRKRAGGPLPVFLKLKMRSGVLEMKEKGGYTEVKKRTNEKKIHGRGGNTGGEV